ncbi:hypothetical protein ACIHCM_31165 [Streptomyces sp. NPDC052023]|uniref:hypothetical protein n=1 Tax=Streptomyces sp. NPDC052023 TaxID=3365681 RepID=UPI0037CE38FE
MKRGTWAVAATVLVLGGLQGCAAEERPGTDPGVGEPTVASRCSGGVSGRSLRESLVSVDRIARQRHPGVFTGLSADEGDRAADVYRVPSAAFDSDVCAAAGKGVTVRLHDTDVSRRELDDLAERIGADMHRWDGTFQLREVGVDERGWVNVGVDDPEAAEKAVLGEFGAEHIRVVRAGQASAD